MRKNGARLYNNGAGTNVVTWGSGENTDVIGNNVWLLFEVVDLGLADARAAALEEMMEVLKQYEGYIFETGTKPGQYDADAVAAFNEAINDAYNSDGDESLTADDIKAITQRIKDTYNAVIASCNTLTMQVSEGYYYITPVRDKEGLCFQSGTEFKLG